MVAAVHLDEQAGLGHALPPAAMAGRAPRAGTADACRAQKALDGRSGNVEGFAFMEQFGELMVIHACIGGAS